MKKILIAVSIALFSACSFAAERVEVVQLSGQTEIKLSGMSEWEPLTAGKLLNPGDSLKTSGRSSIYLCWGESRLNVVGVNESSEIIIRDIGNVKLEIIDASVYARIMDIPSESAFEIKTPTAICGSKGVKFSVDADSDTAVASAFEDDSYVTNEAGEVEPVLEGFTRTVDEAGIISEMTANTAELQNRFKSWDLTGEAIVTADQRPRPDQAGAKTLHASSGGAEMVTSGGVAEEVGLSDQDDLPALDDRFDSATESPTERDE